MESFADIFMGALIIECMHVFVCAYCMCIGKYVNVYIFVSAYISKCVHTYICEYVCMDAYMHVCMYAYMYLCIIVLTYERMYVCM